MSNWTREKIAWREHYERRNGQIFGIIVQHIPEEKNQFSAGNSSKWLNQICNIILLELFCA
jgi:hypothetical protein